MKVTSDELNWCKPSTRDAGPRPMFELHELIIFMKQELIRLADLNDEYESFLKEVKNGN